MTIEVVEAALDVDFEDAIEIARLGVRLTVCFEETRLIPSPNRPSFTDNRAVLAATITGNASRSCPQRGLETFVSWNCDSLKTAQFNSRMTPTRIALWKATVKTHARSFPRQAGNGWSLAVTVQQ